MPNFIDALSKINYEYIPKLEFKDRKFLRKGLWGQEKIYLYICEYNSDEWIEKLLFRDFKKLRCKIHSVRLIYFCYYLEIITVNCLKNGLIERTTVVRSLYKIIVK